MPNYAEAYDFELFETHYDNTVPVREPKRQQRRASNVVELPREEIEKSARPKRHPLRAMAAGLVFSAFVLLAVAMVYSQEQLAVLTEHINSATQTLEESRSLEVQLNMQAAQKMNGAEVENYAINQLGMNKVDNQQVTYVNVAQQDKGTVVQDLNGGTVLDRVLSRIRAWFAE